ncbi:helix-turn-helix domain-containing protein [Myxococcus sp. MxC21-1]|uniref:helix-turn-helix domain-containing protein n=1 Tax=Myxococcus sp. MxC21-1 TaxID=3041439 RepID=UPI003977946B
MGEALENGVCWEAVCERLGVAPRTIQRWRKPETARTGGAARIPNWPTVCRKWSGAASWSWPTARSSGTPRPSRGFSAGLAWPRQGPHAQASGRAHRHWAQPDVELRPHLPGT